MKDKKKKKAAKAPAAHIFLQVFVSGMAVMALELAASRLYAPFFGSSVFVWAGLIGALLLFLAVGYHIGGVMSRAGAGPDRLFLLALAASVYAGVSPYIARPVMIFISGREGLGGNMIPGVLLTSLIALAAPLVLFGCILPLATGILARGESDAGSVAGLLYALSTTGSILGVFLPVLVTLPMIGTRLTFLVFAVAPALVAAAGLGRVLWLLTLLIFIPCGMFSRILTIKPPEKGEKQIAQRETAYNFARIMKKDDLIMMSIDQGWLVYSELSPGKVRTGSYRDYFPLAKMLSGGRDFPRNICILGAAGGTDARIFKHVFPRTRITGVEIDPGLIALGNKYMGLKSVTDRIVMADGRAFLRAETEKYDLIVVDVYNQAYIPFHMTTVEFYRLARARLTPDGVVAFNVAWRSPDDSELVLRCANTLRAVFPSVYVRQFLNTSNTLLFATASNMPAEKVLENLDSNKNEYIRELFADSPNLFQIYNETGPVFTDDKAPVEYLTDVTVQKLIKFIRSGKS